MYLADYHRRSSRRQSGFTLVELALAVAIIALLVGVVLKARELVHGSRVRSIASTATGIQSAYFAFQDRYGRVPGDWNATEASYGIEGTINGGGNDNGRLDTTPADPWTEPNAAWEQLAKAHFIQGEFQGTAATEPDSGNNLAPLNVYNRPIIIGITNEFEGAAAERRHIVVGRGVPVAILRALDVKLDDGLPDDGAVRAVVDDAGVSVFAGANNWGGRQAECVDASRQWDEAAASDDCNAVVIF